MCGTRANIFCSVMMLPVFLILFEKRMSNMANRRGRERRARGANLAMKEAEHMLTSSGDPFFGTATLRDATTYNVHMHGLQVIILQHFAKTLRRSHTASKTLKHPLSYARTKSGDF